MENVELIDYAYPLMMAERRLKDAHAELLNRNFDGGLEKLLEAIVEVRIAVNAVRHMKESS